MKGKKHFTSEEANAIEQLISQKLKADSTKQKGIRNKIRNLGFYASDFGLRGGYTVQDFRNVTSIVGKSTKTIAAPKISKDKTPQSRKQNDESYIIDLCDEVLQLKSKRQHRFDFLRGDSGDKLPVDAYYPSLDLVIEYYERQHTESVPHFDKRMTVSGISRGEQRKRYDELRRTELPKHGINLIIFDYAEFKHTSNKRLIRDKGRDIKVIEGRIKNTIK